VTGEEMIRRMLTSEVDLLYNGGIGTYVKASDEDDADVGDRANDRVRVDAAGVKARVIGEGGNLGLTQKGRIEYWRGGGRCNTDAVDNSGGVDMSDHEVNIKILLDILVRERVIDSRDARNVILQEMTDDVSELVLDDNRHQARCITLDRLRSITRYEEYLDLIDQLVLARVFTREDEAVPSRADLLARPERHRGLPRPLLAVLLGYSKKHGYDETLASTFPDSSAGEPLLHSYFPPLLRERFFTHFGKHPLKREIVATVAINHVINHAGIAFILRVSARTGAATGDIVAAYFEADARLKAADRRAAILAADGADNDARHEALIAFEDDIEAAVLESVHAISAR